MVPRRQLRYTNAVSLSSHLLAGGKCGSLNLSTILNKPLLKIPLQYNAALPLKHRYGLCLNEPELRRRARGLTCPHRQHSVVKGHWHTEDLAPYLLDSCVRGLRQTVPSSENVRFLR